MKVALEVIEVRRGNAGNSTEIRTIKLLSSCIIQDIERIEVSITSKEPWVWRRYELGATVEVEIPDVQGRYT